jgi:hypothetical protein
VLANIDPLMQQLFSIASDSSEDVRKQVCRAFVHVADIAPEKMLPHMSKLQVMLANISLLMQQLFLIASDSGGKIFQDLLELITSPNSRVRADAIAAINIFIPIKLQVVLANIDILLPAKMSYLLCVRLKFDSSRLHRISHVELTQMPTSETKRKTSTRRSRSSPKASTQSASSHNGVQRALQEERLRHR